MAVWFWHIDALQPNFKIGMLMSTRCAAVPLFVMAAGLVIWFAYDVLWRLRR